ncbi:MAG: rhodanese-like domain-containing protein [Vampirovibrionales bacterium]|nr:rhodanese-like domain-containing protein [Vampirovibrionales bacterium]
MPTIVNAQEIQPEATAHIIDVRTRDEFARERIAGSRNIPLDELPSACGQLKSMQHIILSCQSGGRAEQANAFLESMGISHAVLLQGGLNGWKAARRQTESVKQGVSILRQVQMIVGAMVLIGTFYPPLWLLAPIAGAGMLFAGLSNTCMMAVLLAKMPWNRMPASNTQQCALR